MWGEFTDDSAAAAGASELPSSGAGTAVPDGGMGAEVAGSSSSTTQSRKKNKKGGWVNSLTPVGPGGQRAASAAANAAAAATNRAARGARAFPVGTARQHKESQDFSANMGNENESDDEQDASALDESEDDIHITLPTAVQAAGGTALSAAARAAEAAAVSVAAAAAAAAGAPGSSGERQGGKRMDCGLGLGSDAAAAAAAVVLLQQDEREASAMSATNAERVDDAGMSTKYEQSPKPAAGALPYERWHETVARCVSLCANALYFHAVCLFLYTSPLPVSFPMDPPFINPLSLKTHRCLCPLRMDALSV